MKTQRLKTLALSLTIAATTFCGLSAPTARAAEATEKRVEKTAEKSIDESLLLELRGRTKPGDPLIRIFITNQGKEKAKLVEPGLGSIAKVRTSQIAWQIFKVHKNNSATEIKPDYRPGCGNGIFLSANDFFVLEPGQTHEFTRWTYAPSVNEPWTYTPTFDEPGTYRVRFYYDNVPSQPWPSTPNPNLEAVAKRSTPCELISDELEVVVTEADVKK